MKKIMKIRCSIALMSAAIALMITLPVKYLAVDGQEQRWLDAISFAYTHLGEDGAFEVLKSYPLTNEGVQILINHGGFPNHVDELKSLGYTDVDYSPVTGGSNNTTPAPEETTATAPEAFTVEDMDETPMWTVSDVNYRDGASTDYAKIGSLAKYDEVKVNGKASTGWYRFVLEDGTEAYVSDKYLTTEDPHDRELNIYNEETDTVDTYNFEDEDPKVIDEAVEEIKEDYAEKEPTVEEPAPEPAVETPAPVVEEPEPAVEPEPEKEPRSIYWWLVVIGGSGAFLVVCVAVFFLIYNKVRGRVD